MILKIIIVPHSSKHCGQYIHLPVLYTFTLSGGGEGDGEENGGAAEVNGDGVGDAVDQLKQACLNEKGDQEDECEGGG